jgi:hypothetical protein
MRPDFNRFAIVAMGGEKGDPAPGTKRRGLEGHWSRMRSPAQEIGSRDFGAGMVVSRLPGGIWPAQKDPACGDASGGWG